MSNFNESQPYVQHLLAEHHRLHHLLSEARKAVVQRGETPEADAARITATLREVRSELEHHFAEEEQGGCLEVAATRCPSLSAEVHRVEAQHPRLLAELDQLLALIADGALDVTQRVALQNRFVELCRDLHAHEAAENVLLTRGFGMNVNGDETPAELLDR